MKTTRRHFLSLAAISTLMLFSGISRASCDGYYCTDTISLVLTDATGFSITLTNGLSGLNNCTPSAGIYLRVPKTDANYASHYALVLTAKAAERRISFRPIDSSPNCSVQYIFME